MMRKQQQQLRLLAYLALAGAIFVLTPSKSHALIIIDKNDIDPAASFLELIEMLGVAQIQDLNLESEPMDVDEGGVMIGMLEMDLEVQNGMSLGMSIFAEGVLVRQVNDLDFNITKEIDPNDDVQSFYRVSFSSPSTGIFGEITTISTGNPGTDIFGQTLQIGDGIVDITVQIPIEALAPTAGAVPEPASFAVWVMLSSVVAGGMARRRRAAGKRVA